MVSRRMSQFISRVEVPIFFPTITICFIGLMLTISTASSDYTIAFIKGFHLLLGIICLIAISLVPFQMILSLVPIVFILCVAALVGVEFLGVVGKGAKRWLEIGPFTIQPSEIMKGLVPLMIAYYFSDRPLNPTLKDVLKLFFILLIPISLIAIQPDFGTALFVFAIALGCVFLSGIKLRHLAYFISGIVAILPLLWFFYFNEYQKKRILVYLNLESDPLDSGYHILQSKIAIGSGGFFGLGWGQGPQTHLNFIPEFHTDFVFATFCEEYGLIGATLLLSLYYYLIRRLILACYDLEYNSERIVVGGVAMIILLSCFLNLGMVAGLLPVVGVPLPWMSYGGSSTLIVSILVGITMGIINDKIKHDAINN